MKNNDPGDLDQILNKIIEKTGTSRDKTIPILNAVQKHFNYLPGEALKQICKKTDITPAGIMGVATFYSGHRLKPSGTYRIKVCVGTACHVKGADAVFNGLKKHLHISGNKDTDDSGLFTIEKVACLGCCMLAPAVQIDDVIYGHMETGKIPAVLKDFLSSRDSSGERAAEAGYKAENITGEIRLCTCSSCLAAGAGVVFEELSKQVNKNQLPVKIYEVGCTGISFEAPLVTLVLKTGNEEKKFSYGKVEPEHVESILTEHLGNKVFPDVIKRKALKIIDNILTGDESPNITRYALDLRPGKGSLYWGRQVHLATEGCGELSPLDFNSYTGNRGFEGLRNVVSTSNPRAGIEQLKKSGLRGRGGGGFVTADKWNMVMEQKNDEKYIICNGDEGDPGAFMDRMILESFPLRVLEGILIAGFVLKAKRGFIYIREEYPLAIERVKKAIKICYENNMAGDHILGSKFSFPLEVVEGAGAFVCGEETALIAAIEGRRGMPRYKPPYPSESGLRGKPTLINNVETFSLVPWIMARGPKAFTRYGTLSSPGTKTFALAGKIKHGGLIEVPMGITLKEIVYDIGGGISDDKKLKAVQVGGPSGGCVPAHMLDIPVDFDALRSAGSIMGSGGMIVLDETDCMVDIARYFMAFTQSESCGKCTYCRIGTKEMLLILEKLTHGLGTTADIKRLETLSLMVAERSVCGLGKTAPNPVLSTLKFFREEYLAHVNRHCPAKKCKAIIKYRITDSCIGCTRCSQVCPVDAAQGIPFEKHFIDEALCTRCNACREGCPEGSIIIE